MAYSLALGGDTDTIACMAGAIAGAHYGVEAIPECWIRCCEGVEDADVTAEHLHTLYYQSPTGSGSTTGTGKQILDNQAQSTDTKTSTQGLVYKDCTGLERQIYVDGYGQYALICT